MTTQHIALWVGIIGGGLGIVATITSALGWLAYKVWLCVKQVMDWGQDIRLNLALLSEKVGSIATENDKEHERIYAKVYQLNDRANMTEFEIASLGNRVTGIEYRVESLKQDDGTE